MSQQTKPYFQWKRDSKNPRQSIKTINFNILSAYIDNLKRYGKLNSALINEIKRDILSFFSIPKFYRVYRPPNFDKVFYLIFKESLPEYYLSDIDNLIYKAQTKSCHDLMTHEEEDLIKDFLNEIRKIYNVLEHCMNRDFITIEDFKNILKTLWTKLSNQFTPDSVKFLYKESKSERIQDIRKTHHITYQHQDQDSKGLQGRSQRSIAEPPHSISTQPTYQQQLSHPFSTPISSRSINSLSPPNSIFSNDYWKQMLQKDKSI